MGTNNPPRQVKIGRVRGARLSERVIRPPDPIDVQAWPTRRVTSETAAAHGTSRETNKSYCDGRGKPKHVLRTGLARAIMEVYTKGS